VSNNLFVLSQGSTLTLVTKEREKLLTWPSPQLQCAISSRHGVYLRKSVSQIIDPV